MSEHPSPADIFGGFTDPPLRPKDVSLIYQSLLGRAASQDEAAAQMSAAEDWRALLAAVAASDEFQTRLKVSMPREN